MSKMFGNYESLKKDFKKSSVKTRIVFKADGTMVEYFPNKLGVLTPKDDLTEEEKIVNKLI